MKRWITLLLAVAMLACTSCGNRKEVADDVLGPGVTDVLQTQPEIEKKEETETAVDRLAYYEELVGGLKGELLAVKAELFAVRSEYEDRLSALESVASGSVASSEFTYTVSNGSVTITAYRGSAINVQIPSSIDGKPVCAIADRAFLNHTAVQTIVIPEGVETVGWFAFSGCVSLGMVSMPSSVNSIAYGAFENCPSALTVFCPRGCYAESYAKSYGIVTSNG